MDTVDRIIIAPARDLISPYQRETETIDATGTVIIRVQFKSDSSKEISLQRYAMEFIYP